MPDTRLCRCARENGCYRCLAGYHHAICAQDRKEAKQRRTIRYHAARKRAAKGRTDQ